MNSDQYFGVGVPGVLTNQQQPGNRSVSGFVPTPGGAVADSETVTTTGDEVLTPQPERTKQHSACCCESASSAHSLAAVLELVSRINGCTALSDAGDVAACGLAEWLQAAAVDIYFQRKPGRISQSIGGQGNYETDKETIQPICRSAAEEILARSAITDSHSKTKRDQVGTLAVQHYARATSATRILGASLGPPLSIDRDEVCRGAIIVRYTERLDEENAKTIICQLDAAREPLFQCLTRIQQTELPAWYRGLRKRFGRHGHRTRNLILFVAAILCGVLLIPAPYQASVESTLQPVGRRYISTPSDGRLSEVFVRPGDHVDSGTLLATLDASEIEMELAGKRAELSHMRQEQKAQLADHQYARSRLAALQVKRLQSEIELLEMRQSSLQVVAPIAGMIVSGDWKRSEGTVLERGETLFEIAPEGRFTVEVAVDESDILFIERGMPLRFRLDALPQRRFETTILRIHPRSELREDNSVFIVEATLEDSEGLLRPGMRGKGHVETGSHPIGWNWLHRPYHRVLFWIGV